MVINLKAGQIIKLRDGRYAEVRANARDDSEFWFWREVNPDGRLGRLEYGLIDRIDLPRAETWADVIEFMERRTNHVD